ncbi:hypothetical protein SAMN05720764_101387 [Fibrobacter sp. UWH5]|nr:hypothetical protein SAMN05720764_101387 [Fibrobacter sp. UWH5]
MPKTSRKLKKMKKAKTEPPLGFLVIRKNGKNSAFNVHKIPNYETLKTLFKTPLVGDKEKAPLFQIGFCQCNKWKSQDKDTMTAITFVIIDYDDGVKIQTVRNFFKNYDYFLFTTFKHSFTNPRLRVVLRLDAPIPAVQRTRAFEKNAESTFTIEGIKPDCSCFRNHQFQYMPVVKDKYGLKLFKFIDNPTGIPYPTAHLLNDVVPAVPPINIHELEKETFQTQSSIACELITVAEKEIKVAENRILNNISAFRGQPVEDEILKNFKAYTSKKISLTFDKWLSEPFANKFDAIIKLGPLVLRHIHEQKDYRYANYYWQEKYHEPLEGKWRKKLDDWLNLLAAKKRLQ